MKLTKFSRATIVAAIATTVVGMSLAAQFPESASALGSDCDRLRRAIAESSKSGPNPQFQAAAERQRGEIERTLSYAHQLGCENKRFLFFGSDPPAQCGQINAQIGRMRANLEDLQSRAGAGSGTRGELVARFNDQCGGQSAKSSGFMDAIFGQQKPGDLEEQPLGPENATGDKPLEKSVSPVGEARAGGKAVCVRSCDGAFFPLSYSAGGSRLDSLADMCRALCPNAEVTLYTYPITGEIEQAVSINGARYMDSPTALRYRRTFDPSCSCRRRGQTWASALAPAESLLGQEDKTDIIVTPEKSAELSRPKTDKRADFSGKTGKATKGANNGSNSNNSVPSGTPSGLNSSDGTKTDANGVDMVLKDAAAAMSREGSGIGETADLSKSGLVGEDQGHVLNEIDHDGNRRKVRVIGQ